LRLRIKTSDFSFMAGAPGRRAPQVQETSIKST
jgi:hypothetical protein